jgi:hypothetical protein
VGCRPQCTGCYRQTADGEGMTNQQIVDAVEESLPSKVPANVREKILDAVWQVLNDHLGIDIEG